MAEVPAPVAPVGAANLKESVARVQPMQVLVDSHGVELALKISQAHPYDGTGGVCVCGSEEGWSWGCWDKGQREKG